MKKIIFFLLIVIATPAHSQDSCKRQDLRFYGEMTGRITEYYHDNGELSHRFIQKGENTTKVFEWNSCGNLVRKSKSGISKIRKVYYNKYLSIEYYDNEKVKSKRFTKMIGCWHIKRRWVRFYSEDEK